MKNQHVTDVNDGNVFDKAALARELKHLSDDALARQMIRDELKLRRDWRSRPDCGKNLL